MKIGTMNHPGLPVLEEIKLFGNMGFDFVELGIEKPEATPEKLLSQEKEIKDLLDSFNMFLTGHAAWYLDIAHPYDSIRKAALQEGVKIVQVAARFGVKKLAFHTYTTISGMFMRNFREKLVNFNINAIKKLVRSAEEFGMTICVENSSLPGDLFNGVGDFKVLFEKIPKAMFHLDIGHANIHSNKGDRIVDFLKEFKDRLIHIHAHDNKGKRDDHLPIGAGRINWAEVIKAIKEAKYDDTITLEIHASDREYIKISKEKFLDLWKKY